MSVLFFLKLLNAFEKAVNSSDPIPSEEHQKLYREFIQCLIKVRIVLMLNAAM